MQYSKTLYVIVFVIVAALFALFEYELLPTQLIPSSGETTYVVDLASIITSVGGCFALLYAFRFAPIRQRLEKLEDADLESYTAKVCNIRLLVWFVLMLLNIVLYYEASNVTNPKYGIIILFIAGIFCWPAIPAKSQPADESSTSTKQQ